MTDSNDDNTGFQPAPWEAGKPKPQAPYPQPPGQAPARPQPGPAQQPAQPQPPAQPPAYNAPPSQPRPDGGYLGGGGGVPLGGQQAAPSQPQPNANAFGTGEMGRARTRQIPNQQPGPGPQSPQAYQQQPGPAPQAYPQGAPPQGMPPQGAPPQGMPPQGAYGHPQTIPMRKPTSVLAILSLVAIGVGAMAGLMSLGIFSIPFFVVGAVLGYLGMRETASWGKKSGHKMAVGGTIANIVCVVLNVGALIVLAVAVQKVGEINEATKHAKHDDGPKIQKRIYDYAKAKGDILPGGPQMKQGFRNETAVEGPQLRVTDLVTPGELENPIEQYRLQITGEIAIVMWTPPKGREIQVGKYDPNMPNVDPWQWNGSDFQQ
jgi:hypothetical protein